MNTQNDAANAEDFEALYLAYKAKYEAALAEIERLKAEIVVSAWLP